MGIEHADGRPLAVGRYLLFDEVGTGGMASVYVGRLKGPAGFARTVAVKRLHPHFAKDPDFVGMFLDEARLAACVHHPNVASILDVVHDGGDLLLVLEYVSGESLSRLWRTVIGSKDAVPIPVAVAALTGVLQGLHAAHEATGSSGEPLAIIHRDVSPQNIMVGEDGVARVIDFGVAKAAGRVTSTREGQVKGKAGYMAPEQLTGGALDRRVDVFAASVVLWETLTGERLFLGDSDAETVLQVLERPVPPPSQRNPAVPAALDAAVARGLCRAKNGRYATALEMAGALEAAVRPATTREVAEWVKRVAGPALLARRQHVAAIESSAGTGPASADAAPENPTQTQVNTVSASGTEAKRSRASWVMPAFFALALAFGIAALTAAHVGGSPASGADTPVAPSASGLSPPDAPAVASASSFAEGDASATASATPAVADTAPARRAPARRRPASRPDCTPPFTIDPSGIHIPKPSCL